MHGSLFRPPNPTKKWQRPSDLRLDFDLEHGRLNGVGLTEPLDRLSFLGPVEDEAGLTAREYRYFSLGLCIGSSHAGDTIECFDLIQKTAGSQHYLPFSGVCRCRDQNLVLHDVTEQSFLRQCGVPYWRDEDEVEIVLFYELPSLEWQCEFSVDGTFNHIIVTSAPLLANKKERQAYGVTKPWPPKG